MVIPTHLVLLRSEYLREENCLSLFCSRHTFPPHITLLFPSSVSSAVLEGPRMLGSFTNINLQAASLHGSLFTQLTLTSH